MNKKRIIAAFIIAPLPVIVTKTAVGWMINFVTYGRAWTILGLTLPEYTFDVAKSIYFIALIIGVPLLIIMKVSKVYSQRSVILVCSCIALAVPLLWFYKEGVSWVLFPLAIVSILLGALTGRLFWKVAEQNS